jgi:hypothetical protein
MKSSLIDIQSNVDTILHLHMRILKKTIKCRYDQRFKS